MPARILACATMPRLVWSGRLFSAFMFACTEADADSLRQCAGQPIEYTAVLPPDRRRNQQIIAESFGAGEQGIEAVQGAERMAEDGLVLGIDAVFAVEQGGEFVVDKAAEAVGLAVLFAFGFGRVIVAAAACSRGRVGLSRGWCHRCSRYRQSGRLHGFW